MIYRCTKCEWKDDPSKWAAFGRPDVTDLRICPDCGSPVEDLDLEERIAIRVIDGGQDEKEAEEKALPELEIWWEDLAT